MMKRESLTPLQLTLFQYVEEQARGLTWQPLDVPSTLDDTMRVIWQPCRTLPVWSGACERTIYGLPLGNLYFRAWHDAKHVATGRGFDLRSELYVSQLQLVDLAGRSDTLAGILAADTIGQQLHYYVHGRFPENQAAFVESFTRHGRVVGAF